MDNSERIDKFLQKQMTLEEKEMFLNDLRTDTELRKEAQLTALMIKELQERQAKEDAEIINDVISAKRRTRIVRLSQWVGSVAALFILFFGSVRFYQMKQMDDLFDKYYVHYKQNPLRGGSNDKEKEITELFNQVGTEKDVTPTIQKLQSVYESIDPQYECPYATNVTWYLALAYLKDHQREKTIDLLKTIVENDGDSQVRHKAKNLLDDLD